MATIGELMIRAGIDVSELITGVAAVGKELDGLSKEVERTFSGLDKMGARLKDIGMGLTAALTLPIAGIAAASLKMAADFESGMNKVQALGDITGKSLQDLNDLAMKLGAETKFSAKEAADGMGELAAAGLNAAQIAATMPAVLNLAASGEMAVGAAAKAASDLMGEFGIKADGMTHAVDIIAKAAAASSASVSELSVTLKYVGPVAKAAGLSFTETAAAITELANAGIRGSNAGTALRGIIASLESPSKKAQAVLAQYAITVKDAAGNLKPLADLMDEFNKKGLTVADTFKLVGREPAAAFLALKNAGGEALRSLTKDLEDSDGAAKKMADTLNSGLKGAFERASGSIETLGIAIGKSLEPVAVAVAAMVESTANKLAQWAAAFGKLPVGVQEAALAFVALAAAVGPVLLVIGGMAQGFVAVAAAVVPFGAALVSIGGGIATLGGELTVAATAMVSFSAAIIAIGGIALFIEQIIELKDNIKGLVSDVSGISDIWGALNTLFISTPPLVNDVGKTVAGASGDFKLFGVQIGYTAEDMKRISLAWSDFKTAFSDIGWLKLLAGPMAGLNAGLTSLREMIALIKGQFPDMDSAVKKSADSLAAHAQAQMKVSDAALKTAASNRGIVTSFDAVNNATAKVSSSLDKVGKAHDNTAAKAEAAARKAADAYTKMGVDIEKALSSLGLAPDRFSKVIDGIIASLDTLSKAYAAGRITIEQYADASVVAADKVASVVKKSYDDALGYLHAKALEPIEVNWKLQDLGPVVSTMIDNVSLSNPHIDIGMLFPPTSLEDLKKANQSVIDLDDAMKRVGVDTAKLSDHTKQAAADYALLNAAAEKGDVSRTVANEAHVKSLESVIAEMKKLGEAYDEDGVSVEAYKDKLDGLKGNMAGISKAAKDQAVEVSGLEKTWNSFTDGLSRGMSKALEGLLTGQTTFKEAWKSLMTDITRSFSELFIKPITDAISKFVTTALKSLIGGDGFGGVISSAKAAGKAITDVFGGGASAASSAAGTAASGGGAAGAVGAAAGVTNIVGAISGVATAISSIVANFQFSHMNSLLDKIEKSTREMSTVMWQTGGESLQGLAKLTQQWVMFANDRLVDIRAALFDPIAKRLEEIRDKIGSGLGAVADATHEASRVYTQSQVEGAADIARQISDLTSKFTSGLITQQQYADGLAEVQRNAKALQDYMNSTQAPIQATAANTAQAAQNIVDTNASAVNASQAVQGSIIDSGNGIINAVGQSTADQVTATLTSTDALLAQLAQIADVTSNAYTDLKSTIKQAGSDSLAAQADAMQRQLEETRRLASIGQNNLEKGGFVDLANNVYKGANWNIPLTQTNSTTGGTFGGDIGSQFNLPAITNPFASTTQGGNVGSGLVLGSEIAADARLKAPVVSGSPGAGMSISDAERYGGLLGSGGRTTIVNNFNGPIDQEFMKQTATYINRQQVLNGN